MDFKQRWAAASPMRAPISWTMIVCLVMCAGLRVEANDTVPSTRILSTESPQTSSFDTSSNAPRSDVPSKESTVNIAVTVSTTENYTASQSSTTLLSTSFTKDTTLQTQTSKNAATDTMSQTVSSMSAASPTTSTEQPTSVESPTTKPEQPTSAEAPTTETEQPTSPTTNSSLSSSTVPSSATAANNKTEASTEHSVNTENGNTTNAGSTTADINSTNVNTGSPLPASSQSSEKSDGPSTTGVENRATSATNLDSQKSAVVESPATKPPSIIGTPISTEEQRALSPGGVAAITIIVIAIVLVIFGGVAFWKIRNSSYGRLLEDQDYGSLGNYNNPLYDDS